jgi:hypothetical protein
MSRLRVQPSEREVADAEGLIRGSTRVHRLIGVALAVVARGRNERSDHAVET